MGLNFQLDRNDLGKEINKFLKAVEKSWRGVDIEYKTWVQSLACICFGNYEHISPTIAHHTKTRAAGGSDYRTLPFCIKHHDEVHQKGMAYMEGKYGFNHLDEIIRLLTQWLEKEGN